jgi:signal transduction histidine kinase
MKRRSVILILLIVLLPVALLAWLGWRIAWDEQQMTRQRFRGLMEQRLQDVNRQIAAQFDSTERRLQSVTAIDNLDVQRLRDLVRNEPHVTQLFVLSADGTLLYPNPAEALNGTELSFLQQAAGMFTDRDLQTAIAQTEAATRGSDFQSTQPGRPIRGTMPGILNGPVLPQLASADFPVSGLENSPASPDAADPRVLIADGSARFVPGRSALPEPSSAPFNNTPSIPLQTEVSSVQADALAGGGGGAPAGPLPQIAQARSAQARMSANDPSVQVRDQAAEVLADSPAAAELDSMTDARSEPATLSDPANTERESASEFMDARSRETGDALPDTEALSPSGQPGSKDDDKQAQSAVGRPATKTTAPTNGPAAPSYSSGWFVWYWDRGMNLIYWQRRPSGKIVGAALERARWIADVLAVLPDSSSDRTSSESFRVVGSSNDVVYEWGAMTQEDTAAFCEIPLVAPLGSWRMQCFVAAGQLPAGFGSSLFAILSAVVAVALTLSGLAWMLYRDYARDMREAGQQVSFVNQVSHELKTPLTNIRMYADLLERDLEQVPDDQAHKPRKRLDVITTEAQRLSRLIGNVLTFARQQRKTLQVHPVSLDPGSLLKQIVDRFSPSLTERGLRVELDVSDCATLLLDPDLVEQIVGNLISNVEKYAAAGGTLKISGRCMNGQAVIDVIDAGPGIPREHREEVFRPFARVSSDLRASTGTGIGLSIARDLARLHGGDVKLLDSDRGCWFQVHLVSREATG